MTTPHTTTTPPLEFPVIRSGSLFLFCLFFLPAVSTNTVAAQGLEQQLKSEPVEDLAADVQQNGNANRGAALFHLQSVGCSRCHAVGDVTTSAKSIGPNLALLKSQQDSGLEHIIDSVLYPSKKVRDGYQSIVVVMNDGRTLQGMQVGKKNDDSLTIRDPRTGQDIVIKLDDIDEVASSKQSLMPVGLVNAFRERQQFLDLAKYLIEIRDGGPQRAKALQPSADQIAFRLPEYESHLDHAGLIRNLDDESLKRGEKIYSRVCMNCHGSLDRPGSLPTALRFAEGKFRNGHDPFAMYQTVTNGFGLMVPQTWMAPVQKYDVIHYIRETYLKDRNPSQYAKVSESWLKSLPPGDTFGPEAQEFAPWSDMDYGRTMFNTFEVGQGGRNIAYKGIAFRVDQGTGGVSKGNRWTLFDHDTMRVAANWSHSAESDSRFINWQGIHFDGRHGAHPRIAGRVALSNPTGPGWANPETLSFEDDSRVIGRDGKRYGPLPRKWSQYRGLRRGPDGDIIEYSVGDMTVLESHSSREIVFQQSNISSKTLWMRKLQLGPSTTTHRMVVATDASTGVTLQERDAGVVEFGVASEPDKNSVPDDDSLKQGRFNGNGWLQSDVVGQVNVHSADYSFSARIRTKADGTIFAVTTPGPKWVPDGVAVFVRGGRLTLDIGWVGAVRASRRVDDGKWHDVAVTWSKSDGKVQLYLDRELVGSGTLAPKSVLRKRAIRIGFAAPDFPARSPFVGQIADVKFFDLVVDFANDKDIGRKQNKPVASWLSSDDQADSGPELKVVRAGQPTQVPSRILAGIAGDVEGLKFVRDGSRLCLEVPAAVTSTRTVIVWTATPPADAEERGSLIESANGIANRRVDVVKQKRESSIEPSAQWREVLTTTVKLGEWNKNGFAVDQLTAPAPNPWLARLRFSGLDFFEDGDRMAVCSWDGDVFIVSGLKQLDGPSPAVQLTWKRIVSGLFQPLGLKIIDGEIFVTCRDQLAILRDTNGDGSTDVIECFNNDHQVTEHFHEFAMGLQRDDEGNLYYAKSARHAKTALVPHHGTLLKVSADGKTTSILATGFRAANGVCLNPDGSFVVTDQEGHWNPKNRINWVKPGGFYGNMYGYHDVEDDSDSAMVPPLCWITNSFDRSPSELLWVPEGKWGNLSGTLLNLSYGYGKVYTVPHEAISGASQVQGGMCELPIPQFPTGTMRGRFHPVDGQLYVCGLFAWGSSRQLQEGGLFRIRYQGTNADMPVAASVSGDKLTINLSDPIAKEATLTPDDVAFKVWDLKRTRNYGSKHYNERTLEVQSVRLSDDRRKMILTIPNLSPTWCYELKWTPRVNGESGVERIIHGTINELNKPGEIGK